MKTLQVREIQSRNSEGISRKTRNISGKPDSMCDLLHGGGVGCGEVTGNGHYIEYQRNRTGDKLTLGKVAAAPRSLVKRFPAMPN